MTPILVKPTNLRPIACPTAASRPIAKKLFDLGLSHAVEIVGDLDLPGEEPKAGNPTRFRGIQRHDLD